VDPGPLPLRPVDPPRRADASTLHPRTIYSPPEGFQAKSGDIVAEEEAEEDSVSVSEPDSDFGPNSSDDSAKGGGYVMLHGMPIFRSRRGVRRGSRVRRSNSSE